MKELDKKIAVEPLDEVRLARIERRLVRDSIGAPRAEDGRRRGWAWPAIAATLAVVLALVVWRSTLLPSGAIAPATEFAVSTGASPTTLDLGGAGLEVAPRSAAKVASTHGVATRVVVEQGSIHFVVESRADRPTFSVEAADVVVTVVGTSFSVERRGAGVAVEVEEGIVLVERGGKSVRLSAGQSWRTETFVAAIEPALDASVEEPDAAADRPDEPGGDSDDRGPDRAGLERADVRDAGAQARKPDPPKAPVEDKPEEPVLALSPYRAPSALDPIMEAPAGPPEQVESFYREQSLVRGDSERAALALYSTAYWQLYRRMNPRAALHAAELYEGRFRRGKNAESVLWVRIAALCAAGRDSECRAAAHSYSRRYPGGRFAPQIKSVINRERE